jgi:hypothetical protein
MTGVEVAVAFAAASTVFSTMGALQAAGANAAAAEFNAQVHERNAKIARDQAAADAEDTARENRRKIGLIRAQYGASGLDMAGSPLDMLSDTIAEGELDVRRTIYKGAIRATEETDKGNLARMEKKSELRSMPFIAATGVTKAGSTLLSG